MSFLRRKSADSTVSAEPEAPVVPAEPVETSAARTAGKGRPTPKRREAQGRRGPVAPPPMTQREAVKRAKAQSRSMTKDERRAAAADRREKMMRGDDAYVLPRDRGPVRAFVRDLVDSRRNLAGLLLPIAALSILILIIPVPAIQVYGPLVLMVLIAAAILDMVIYGRTIGKKVRARFPNGDPSGLPMRGSSLGFYAFNRACLIRKWRAPRPRVTVGQVVD
ncbi:DUF3043 domain-containing protein [Nakamurella flava]|uniref:DUF3043 domain-containing protein n=1 Tax=Nakamurella flava TaxID=2576308 RepID=A0A4U6QJH4_9ACTN|nr:DUF3043 domain-containing protein [Nakamurella flava]TKV60441.1 DUF3043 domain-containing protein [Nakamurella flava]